LPAPNLPSLGAYVDSFSVLGNADAPGVTSCGFSDLIPQASLRSNAGVNNFMTCITGGIPVGT
jgi:hypothetical protein